MPTTLTGIVLRIPKGSPLTDQQGDNNLTLIVNFANGLSQIIGASLNPDGSIKAGAINAVSQFGNLSTLADTFAINETLDAGVFATGNYTVTNANVTALTTGSRGAFLASAANTGATTVTFTDGTTPLPIVALTKSGANVLAANDILAGQIVAWIYDGANLQIVQTGNLFASAADILAGTDATKVVTSAGLKSASLSFTSALTPMTFAGGLVLNVNHGLLATPTKVYWVFHCVNAELGYVPGDEVLASSVASAAGGYSPLVGGANATSVFLVYDGQTLAMLNKLTGVFSGSFVNNLNWSVRCYASL